MEERKNKVFGLLGKDIEYSFSRGYFTEKFEKLDLKKCKYVNFDIPKIEDFPSLIEEGGDKLRGINVTIPYKEVVMKYLDKLDKTAKEIGAVNTIKFTKRGNLKGYNSDVVGFEKSIFPLIKKQHKRALILGTGGASKAIAYALKKNDIKFKFVSRNPEGKKEISYQDLTETVMEKYQIIINSTPVGTSPNTDRCPDIPYQFITENHLLYDLIYNPEVTTFLAKGKAQGATIKNGYEMLQLQAEESWRIWNT
ncbi:shikimate dehydrogenase [Polaribacter sp. Z014]|uniref:shikimate dehydrogenase family protein n=1 Tax=unclassified Polaribacter TaxID=196858 RepID=UPI00193C2508|nr:MULTISPECIES: shikimate dehydrogenase [unclassified Polaribacter]MCL7764254.1 shikimate dehydrogenase [Polaribacter sp. Z014]QVY65835.1 shikimate dehydrogenase [Polaribacter sp. Q13]